MATSHNAEGRLLAGRTRRRGRPGFSLLELMIVVAIILVILGFAIPSGINLVHSYAIRNDANSIMGLMANARMRAAADFARTKVECNSTTGGCAIKVATYTAAQADPNTPAATDYVADKQAVTIVYLSKGVSLAIPSGATTGVGGQSTTTPKQSTANGTNPCSANPYCVFFNSRGLPVNNSGTLVTDYAFYLSDSKYNLGMAIGMDITGKATLYRFNSSLNTWARITE
jgi:prepilin-type N-terminal cleavage/methylation domain-containing protein